MARDPLLAQIHIARQQLQLEDDDYRALLRRVTGKTSSAELSDTQRRAVIAELKRRGFKARGTGRAKSSKPYIRKVFALWGELKREGIWREDGVGSLRAFVKKMAGVDDPEFMDYAEATKVIEAMKKIRPIQNLAIGALARDTIYLAKWTFETAQKELGNTSAESLKTTLESMHSRNYPKEYALVFANPGYRPGLHTTVSADYGSFWGLVRVSKPVDGTYEGETLDLLP